MKPNRRQFLGLALGAAAVPFAPRLAFARAGASLLCSAPDLSRVLVLVDLAGGNDGLNTVVPFAHDAYHRARPTLRTTKENLLALNDEVGLRRELAGVKQLFDRGRVAIVQGVGYAGPDRSHFRSSDIWHTASLTPEKVTTGWIGRLSELDDLRVPSRIPALMIGNDKIPLALLGEHGAAPQVESLDRLALPTGPDDGASRARVDAMKGLARADGAPASSALDFVRSATRQAQEVAADVERAAEKGRASATYPATPLGAALRLAAQLISGGLPCTTYYVRQPGYDTHAFQADAHALLLQELGDALAAFFADLDRARASERVALLAWSEFGRRLEENGSRGTDHGAAAPIFVLGGRLRGGVIGAHPSLEAKDLEDGDVRFRVDFRRAYVTLVEDWLGVPAKSVLAGDGDAAAASSFAKLPLFGRAV